MFCLTFNRNKKVGTTGTLTSYIAIDDISVDPGTCHTSPNMFNCTDTEQIPQNKVCDYVVDCSNGMDEKECGSCNFENNFDCGFGKTFRGIFS